MAARRPQSQHLGTRALAITKYPYKCRPYDKVSWSRWVESPENSGEDGGGKVPRARKDSKAYSSSRPSAQPAQGCLTIPSLSETYFQWRSCKLTASAGTSQACPEAWHGHGVGLLEFLYPRGPAISWLCRPTRATFLDASAL